MGIINVTPDSFSDGGKWMDPEAAIAHGKELIEQGADILDIGWESTRPGAQRVSEREELARVLPVIWGLKGTGVTLSIDTMRASVAARAVGAGVSIVNDVSGGLADPEMFAAVAGSGADYVCQHWRGFGDQMNDNTNYDNVITDVRGELTARIAAAIEGGIDPQRIIADPGLGFAKNTSHDWSILAHLEEFQSLGHRLLIGASRKRVLAQVAGEDLSVPGEVTFTDRDNATAAVSAICADKGVWAVRVHTVRPSAVATRVAERINSATQNIG
jgi:dihydropteroate synthase